jgi:hypothetical protein
MPLELSDVLHIATKDGRSLPFEVVGILEDGNDGASYAVLFREAEGDGEFIVTDVEGKLLEDAELAQEILDDFLHSAHENE